MVPQRSRITRRRVGACRWRPVSFPRRSAPPPEPGPFRPSRTRSPLVSRLPESAPAPVRRPAEAPQLQASMLADHLPLLGGRTRHEFHVDIPPGNVAQPGAVVQGTDISRGSASEHIRPVRVGWRHDRLGRNCLHGDRRPRVCSGLTHTDAQRRPPGLSTRANSAVALATSGKNMYPKRTETLSNVASSNGKSSALHTCVSMLAIPCALARRAAMSTISATTSVSTTRPFGDSRAMLSPGSPVPAAMSKC